MFEALKRIFNKNRRLEQVPMTLITVKRNKNVFNCYKGKFVSIDVDLPESYYFNIYDRNSKNYVRVTNKVNKQYMNICSKYNYGLIYDFNDEELIIAVICHNGYLKTYDVKMKDNFSNGEAFIINGNNLINNNKIVGTINNNTNEKILMNCLEDNKLICFISK